MRNIILTSFAAVLLAGAITAAAAMDYVEGELIVEFADGVELDPPPGVPDGRYPELDALGLEYGVYESAPVFELPTEPIEHPFGLWTWEDWQDMEAEERLPYFFVLKYHSQDEAGDVAAAYAACELVESAEPDYIGEAYFHPNDPHYVNGDQWYLYYAANRECDISAPEGWEEFISVPGGRMNPVDIPKPTVAVVDSGICMYGTSYENVHSDIKANVTPGRDIIHQDDYPEDAFGHGTAIAGIIGATWNNNLGIAGIGKNDSKVQPIRITYDFAPLKLKAAAGGIAWALRSGDVINMSWGFPINQITPEELNVLKRAVEGAWRLDINTVAASGNSGGPLSTYPAIDYRDRMICVGGTDRVATGWARWEMSSWPPQEGVDVVAPMRYIYSTWLNNGYKGDEWGTSYACAMVSGTVAGYRHMLTRFGEPRYYPKTPGIDMHALECVYASGPDYPDHWKVETGYGTTYYNWGLNRAIEIRPGGDGGLGPTAAAALATITATTNFPNPAKAATKLRVELGNCNVTEASYAIYDLSGRKVRELKGPVKGGRVEAVWDLADSAGARVPPGVYIWRVEVGPASATKKCVVN